MADSHEGDGNSSEEEIRGRKRRNEANWKRNKRKILKAEGKAYVSSRGKEVPARCTGNKCRCSRGCLQSFSDESKRVLLDNFNKLADSKAQDAFLYGGISPTAVQRRRVRNGNGPQRSVHVVYKVNYGEEQKVVCREAYGSLFGIGDRRLRRISAAVYSGNIPEDNRGKHDNRPNSVTEESKRLIDQHIRSFPFQVSHYGRERTKRRYLSSDLSRRKMYTLFLQQHFPDKYLEVKNGKDPESVECPIRHRTYINYFNDHFNYGFGRPRSDVCGTCEELKVKISTEKNSTTRRKLETDLQVHKRKAAAFYNSLRYDSQLAEESDDVETICIDFQQNMPYPHLPVGEVFYMRQLWLFNFCIYSAKTKTSTMYMYPETTAKRGANEVISFLNHFFENKLSDKVKRVKLYSDGCRGQNHNHSMVQYLFTLVNTGRFEVIEHHFPIRGHSFLPCDRHFATIERKKRRKDTVEWYDGWISMVEESFEVVRVEQNMIKDFRPYLAQFFKKSTKRGEETYKVSEYKLFSFSQNHKYEVEVSSSMTALNRTKFGLLKPGANPSLDCGQSYHNPVPVKAAKKQDIVKLKKYLAERTRYLVDQLTTTDRQVPDDEDDDSDYGDYDELHDL